MKLELELKYVQNYLDSSIKCIYKGNKYNVVKCSRNWIWIINQENALLKLKYSEVKLILRPLSDLTKEINHCEKYFIPLAELLISIPQSDFRFKNYNKTVIECWNYSNDDALKFYLPPIMGLNKYQDVEKLISWHFDVFGLIENNLAIDINTL